MVTQVSGLSAGRHSLDANEIVDPRTCLFGQWFFNEGSRDFGRLPAFQELNRLHVAVHTKAREIARLQAEGDCCDCATRLEGLGAASSDLCDKLDQLSEELQAATV